jgi:hypothetical membrane protein
MQRSNKNLAGLLLFAGSTIGFLGIIIAETQYPNYSTANNFISDLGIGTTGAYFLSRSLKNRLFPVLVGLSSLGSVFVGVFPEDTGIPHAIAALLAFIAGGVAAIISYRYLKTPFRYVSVALGALSLLSFILFLTGIHLGLGAGGMERMIAYPNIIWSIGFGGNLMADSTETK